MIPCPAAIPVLIVDDSATVRSVLRRLLSPWDDIVVVGEASDGREAVAAAAAFNPRVILMDVEMPHMNGVEATHLIMSTHPTAILVITSRSSQREVRNAFACFAQGALELLAKPEHPAAWAAMAQVLPEKIRALAAAAPVAGRGSAGVVCPRGQPRGTLKCIAVGASTGGPTALQAFLTAFPDLPPGPVLVVQHISPGFEQGLVDWLATVTGLDVRVARHGESPPVGVVRIAPADFHLRFTASGTLELDGTTPPRGGHRPSADELFFSCAEATPVSTAGILLTGMGRDGATGLARLRQRGGLTLVQDEASCAVFGMPRAALEEGGAEQALPPAALAAAVLEYARERRP